MFRGVCGRQSDARGNQSGLICAQLGVLVIALLCSAFPGAMAAIPASPASLCLAAAQGAAERTGVPVEVLQAISIVETGRASSDREGLDLWPWALNHAGEGYWFETVDEAKAQAAMLIDQGVRNIDLGCFQLNLHWHSKAFSGLDAMLDPNKNALYAAEFLQDLYAKTGSWSEAAGAYHSSTPEHAADYRVKFDETLAALQAGGRSDVDAIVDLRSPELPRQNRFPLLLAGARGNGGSLVPRLDNAQPLIGVP